MLTNERAELIGKYLTENNERAKELLTLSPAEATVKMNADGHDFSEEEVMEFGEQLKAALVAQEGELTEDALGDVSGGCLPSYSIGWVGIIPVIRVQQIW